MSDSSERPAQFSPSSFSPWVTALLTEVPPPRTLATVPEPKTKSARSDLAPFIDHTLLSPTADAPAIEQLCAEAAEHGFYSVCVASRHVALARRALAESVVRVCAVVGFPHGDASTAAKVAETAQCCVDGVDEIDVVVAQGALREGDHEYVVSDLRAVVDAAGGRPVKVILETADLDERTIIVGAALSKAAGAAFVKTATGFGPGGATAEAIALMREVVGPDLGVKASGGVRDAETADAMIAAGANRLGASAGLKIVGAASTPTGDY